MQNEYDVIIVGGGTAGCSCAWNCSRLGLKTLLIEKKTYLGGAITGQLVVPAMKTEHCNINTEFFKALIKAANEEKAQITYEDCNPGWFNPLKLSGILLDMLEKTGCRVLLNSTVYSSCIDTEYIYNKKIISVCVESDYSNNSNDKFYIGKKDSDNIGVSQKENLKNFSANYFVDATGDGNLSEMSGAEFLPFEKSQAMSLRFIMGGVNKNAFADWLLEFDNDRNVTTACEAGGEVHLSTACTWDLAPNWALKPIFDKAVSEDVLKDSDRAYFQVFSIAGEPDKIAFNCPRIIADRDFSPLNEEDKEKAENLGREAIGRLETFCRKYFKGFENAKVIKIADELGVRESRRVKGKYVLTKEDIYTAKTFEHTAACSNYPIDVHSVKKDDYTLNYVQKTYAVPLESLIVKGFSNLFVIGRCLSADFYAQAAVRIQPTCFSMGEAAANYIKNVN